MEIEITRPLMLEVSFGARGRQHASFQRLTKDHALIVCKYRARSDTWTKPMRVMSGEVKRAQITRDNYTGWHQITAWRRDGARLFATVED